MKNKKFLGYCIRKEIMGRSVKVGLIVGTILALINHFESIFSLSLSPIVIFKILLTYLVPYSVTTYSAVQQCYHEEKND